MEPTDAMTPPHPDPIPPPAAPRPMHPAREPGDTLGPDHRGPEHPPNPCDTRRGVPVRVRVLTPGWRFVLAALLIGGVYLAGSPQDRSARRVGLGELAGQTRAITFGPGDQWLAATMLDGAIRSWRIGPGSGWAVPC